MTYKIEVDGVEVDALTKAEASALVHDSIDLEGLITEPEDDGS